MVILEITLTLKPPDKVNYNDVSTLAIIFS